MNVSDSTGELKLFSFSFVLCLITYGFALSNFTITIDNEMPILPDFGMEFGRWGQNFIRYHIFKGTLPYFTLLFSLFIFTIAAIRFARLFRFTGISAYAFCALFLTFPQISYQVVFSIMADVAAIGILLSLFCVELFIAGTQQISRVRKFYFFTLSALLLMFTLSIYQAFILVPIVIYLIRLLQNTFLDGFNLRTELLKVLSFGAVMFTGTVLYAISVKLICAPIENGSYLMSFMAGNSDNQFFNFLTIWRKNLFGTFYYGERTFIIAFLASIVLLFIFLINRKLFFLRVIILIGLLLLPFIMSALITNGYHPPRLYLTTNLVFAFLIVYAIDHIQLQNHQIVRAGIVSILVLNIYYITNLFNAAHRIYKHDRQMAENIDDVIRSKYPDFHTTDKTVYFYGHLPYDYHNKFRLENSEIFSGTFYTWDNGSNYRIINFFREADVADYKMIETHEQLNLVKDSAATMPVWPDPKSIKKVNDIIIIKLSREKGAPLHFE